MTANFMVSDLAVTSLAFVLFPLFVFIPGYVLAWALDLLDFRSRTLLGKLAISTPVSISAFPVLTYLAWSWSLNAVWCLFGACWLAFCALLFRDRWKWPVLSRSAAILCWIVAGWAVLGMCFLVDLQIGDRLYFPTVSYDYLARAPMTSAIARSGIPPNNPFFSPGQAFPLRYHYFWLIPAALVDLLGGSLVTARQAVIAGTLWCGIGLMAMVPLYLRFFQPNGAARLDRRALVGIALLGVTGLDIVPIAALGLLAGGVVECIEWWNEPVMAWTHAVVWVPHHVAALVACLTGFLVVYHSFHRPGFSRFKQVMAASAGGVMFASSAGMSIYVTFVFAVALAVLFVLLLIKRYRAEASILALSGMVAVAVSVPYLMELSGGSGPGAGGGDGTGAGPFVQLRIRPFTLVAQTVRAIVPDQPWAVPVTNLLLLPLNYFLELGLFFIVGTAMFKRFRRMERLQLADMSALALAITSVLICTFLRSGVITNNDLGWRGLLVAQFILLIWAADLWDEGFFTGHAKAGLIAVFLAFGIAGTVYEVVMVRFYTLISDDFDVPRDGWFPADHHLGERTYALRTLYQELQHKLPATATLQHNPNAAGLDVFHGLYADRQTAVESSGCAVVFGGDVNLCNAVMPSIANIFDKRQAPDWLRVEATCRQLSIGVLVVMDTDEIWADPHSWVWTRQPLVANKYGRAFLCGNQEAARSPVYSRSGSVGPAAGRAAARGGSDKPFVRGPRGASALVFRNSR